MERGPNLAEDSSLPAPRDEEPNTIAECSVDPSHDLPAAEAHPPHGDDSDRGDCSQQQDGDSDNEWDMGEMDSAEHTTLRGSETRIHADAMQPRVTPQNVDQSTT